MTELMNDLPLRSPVLPTRWTGQQESARMKAIEAFIESQGGPEVIDWREVTLGEPGPGQVLLRQTAVGLNYLDIYHRDGTYPIDLPGGLGVEAAGEVVAVGDRKSTRLNSSH